jgi:peptidase E
MAADGNRHIVAMGGVTLIEPHSLRLPALLSYALELSGAARPRVCVLDTANGDAARSYIGMYPKLVRHGAIASHLQLFTMPNVSDPEQLLMSQDVIFVGGGSMVNMLAVWQAHGLDKILRRAWEAGIVLAGVSAGAMCWFEGATTDSFGLPLRPYAGGLGLLPGSFCPHYSQEPERRPVYRQFVSDGTLPAGIACDDGAAAHYIGDQLAGILSDRPGATGYLVTADGSGAAAEQALPSVLLAAPPGGPSSWPGLRSAHWIRSCYYGYQRYRAARWPRPASVSRAAEADQPAG